MANEKRLIDADKIGNGIALYMAENAYLNDTALDVLKMVGDWVDKAPTVDAVPVVRCKDCKHSIWDEDEGLWKCVYDAEFDEQYGEYFGFVEYNDGLHFCSYGERREGE